MRDFVPWAEVDHAALRHNLRVARETAPGTKVWAVVKADAYGHGAVWVSRTLGALADGLAVARVDEAVQLREAGVAASLLVLEGPFSEAEIELARHWELQVSLHNEYQIGLLQCAPPGRPLRFWVKVDTGMHRLGFPACEVPRLRSLLSSCPALAGSPRWMTHLANADDLADPLSEQQTRRIREELVAGDELSVANSAGTLGWPSTHADWIRPGIMLYGASPFRDESGGQRRLQPVMTLRARVIAVQRVRRGEGVGYGGEYRCPQDMDIGVIGIGYGDGYPRHAPSGTPVLLGERRVPLVGRVSMDMITVDLRGRPETEVGEEAVLWGAGLPVEEVALAAGTISYELLCGLTPRVRRVHRAVVGST